MMKIFKNCTVKIIFIVLLSIVSSCVNKSVISFPVMYENDQNKVAINNARFSVYQLDAASDSILQKLLSSFTNRSMVSAYLMRFEQQELGNSLVIEDCDYRTISRFANSYSLGVLDIKAKTDKTIVFLRNDFTEKRFVKTNRQIELSPQYVKIPREMMVGYLDEVSMLKCTITTDSVISDECLIRSKKTTLPEMLKASSIN